MEKLYKDFLSVIKCGITGNKAEDTSALFDWENIYAISNAHKIHMILYYGILEGGFTVPQEVLNAIKSKAFSEVAFSMRQNIEIQELFKELESNEIDFLPLKGAVMKDLYSHSDMRLMSDIDILIKPHQYEKIKEIMLQNNYEFIEESDHEFVWKKKDGFLCVEFHKHLVPSYNKDLYPYYGDGWKVATRNEGTHYYMSDEDFFIYMFVHFAKHYRDSGIGIRQIVDIWVCLEKLKLDYFYIEEQLKELYLYDFFININRTLDVWFNNGEESEETELITNWIFTSGIYGTKENNLLSGHIRKNGNKKVSKVKLYFKNLFPRYSAMKKKYQLLNKMPILLPFAWIWRIVYGIMFSRKNAKIIVASIDYKTDENINAYKNDLEKVGIKYR